MWLEIDEEQAYSIESRDVREREREGIQGGEWQFKGPICEFVGLYFHSQTGKHKHILLFLLVKHEDT